MILIFLSVTYVSKIMCLKRKTTTSDVAEDIIVCVKCVPFL